MTRTLKPSKPFFFFFSILALFNCFSIGLMENALYGGRIDSQHDMLILKTYLQMMFNKSVFLDSGKLQGGITANPSSKTEDHLKGFSALPNKDSPATFGLPPTADISVQKFRAKKLIQYLRAIKTGKKAQKEYNKNTWKTDLTPILKLWKSLYKSLNDSGVIPVSEEDLADPNPIRAFVLSELRQGLLYIRDIGEQMRKLIQLIKGEIPLDKELKGLGSDLMANRLPGSWLKKWQGPATPSEWLKLMMKKVIALNRNLKKMPSSSQVGDFLMEELSLADMFNPEVFLNSHRMIVAKETKCSMENLKLVLSFDGAVGKVLKIGGLLIQGCKLERGKLVKLGSEDKDEFTVMPTCFVGYEQMDKQKDSKDKLKVPLYSDFGRENLICYFDLKIDGNRMEKIVSGVAMAIKKKKKLKWIKKG